MKKQLLLLTAASLFIMAPAAQQQVFGEDSSSMMIIKEDKVISDADLIASVKKVLSDDKDLSKYVIDVKADKGIVTLSGKVGSVKDKIDIGVKVKAVEGVRDVINNLEIAA